MPLGPFSFPAEPHQTRPSRLNFPTVKVLHVWVGTNWRSSWVEAPYFRLCMHLRAPITCVQGALVRKAFWTAAPVNGWVVL